MKGNLAWSNENVENVFFFPINKGKCDRKGILHYGYLSISHIENVENVFFFPIDKCDRKGILHYGYLSISHMEYNILCELMLWIILILFVARTT